MGIKPYAICRQPDRASVTTHLTEGRTKTCTEHEDIYVKDMLYHCERSHTEEDESSKRRQRLIQRVLSDRRRLAPCEHCTTLEIYD